MVISVGDVKSQNWMTVFDDIKSVVDAVGEQSIVKVILETGYLSDSEIIFSSLLAAIAGADFVKTSTGFSGSGATVKHVALMRRVVGPTIGVKASGGIRTPEVGSQMLQMGASRLGASRGPGFCYTRMKTIFEVGTYGTSNRYTSRSQKNGSRTD